MCPARRLHVECDDPRHLQAHAHTHQACHTFDATQRIRLREPRCVMYAVGCGRHKSATSVPARTWASARCRVEMIAEHVVHRAVQRMVRRGHEDAPDMSADRRPLTTNQGKQFPQPVLACFGSSCSTYFVTRAPPAPIARSFLHDPSGWSSHSLRTARRLRARRSEFPTYNFRSPTPNITPRQSLLPPRPRRRDRCKEETR